MVNFTLGIDWLNDWCMTYWIILTTKEGTRKLQSNINYVNWVETIFRFGTHLTRLRSTSFAGFADDIRFRFPFPSHAQKLFLLEPACTPTFPILKDRVRSIKIKELSRRSDLKLMHIVSAAAHLQNLRVKPETSCLVARWHHFQKPIFSWPSPLRMYMEVSPTECSLHCSPLRSYITF